MLRAIQRSSLEETRITRQTVKYKGGKVVNGNLKDRQILYAEVVTETRPPTIKGSMWLLARRFPKKWGLSLAVLVQ